VTKLARGLARNEAACAISRGVPMPPDAPVTNAVRPSCSPTPGYLHTSWDERKISGVKRAPVTRRADVAAGEGTAGEGTAGEGTAGGAGAAPAPPAPGVSVLTPLDRRRSGTRTSDLVYAELAAAIQDLRLPPGQGLSETELAARLGVSRTPVREAISRLVESGLVSVVPQVGTRVCLIRLDEVMQAQFIREHLEVAAFCAACAACAQPSRDTALLTQILRQQREAHRADDFGAFFAADEAFHTQIFALSGHLGAWEAVQRSKVQLDRLRRLAPESLTVQNLIRDHSGIAQALERGQLDEGRMLVTMHARRVFDYAPVLQARYPGYFE
jgi:DNA-binding GntR family transcriptional regulator